MKTATKKIMITPETIKGACMTGNKMTSVESELIFDWVKKDKAKQALKKIKKLQSVVEAAK